MDERLLTRPLRGNHRPPEKFTPDAVDVRAYLFVRFGHAASPLTG